GMGRLHAILFCVATLPCPSLLQAHHSPADFDRNDSHELRGVLVGLSWSNPHILLTVEHEGQRTLVEWITTAGTERTGADRERFVPGSRIVLIGSRHRDPARAEMSLVREL